MDMGGWNLTCEWPSDLLSAFSQLDTLNVESNPGLTVRPSRHFSDWEGNRGVLGGGGGGV